MKSNFVKGISHITFVCKDLEKTGTFLKYIFDAKEVYASGDRSFSLSREKFFTIGELWIAIMEGESINQTYNHIAFKVDASLFSELRKKIETLGLTILPGRARKKAEGESLYFYDYDNHLFELHSGDLETRLRYYSEETK